MLLKQFLSFNELKHYVCVHTDKHIYMHLIVKGMLNKKNNFQYILDLSSFRDLPKLTGHY